MNLSGPFSDLSAEARAAALLDGAHADLERHGALLVGRGQCEGRQMLLALTDRRIAGGSFGSVEAGALGAALQSCRSRGEPIVMVLDSAGARLHEGLPALGAFRLLFREALLTRLSGVPMIALLARDCFGGASMLAAVCAVRAAASVSRYGMSGPSIIEALGGREELDAGSARQVRALFGGRARARLGAIDRICRDSPISYRQALAALLQTCPPGPPDLLSLHRRLRQRLLDAGVEVTANGDALAALAAGRPLGALALWRLAERVLALDPGATLTVPLDAPGHATTRIDESLALTEYVVHASLCIAERGSAGHDIRLLIRGEAAGGIYVALAAPAARVDAVASAQVRVLPRAAVQRVLGRAAEDEGLERAIAAGVIEGVNAA